MTVYDRLRQSRLGWDFEKCEVVIGCYAFHSTDLIPLFVKPNHYGPSHSEAQGKAQLKICNSNYLKL